MRVEALKRLLSLSLLAVPLLVFLRGRCSKKKKKREEKKQPPLRFSGLFSRLPHVNKELTFVGAAYQWHMRMDARECLGCATAFDGRALCLCIFLPSSDRLANHGGARRTANEEPPPPPRWFTLGVERRRPQKLLRTSEFHT